MVLHVLGRWRPGGVTRLVESIVAGNAGSDTRHDVLVTLPPKDDDSIPELDSCALYRLDFTWRRIASSYRRIRRIMAGYDAIMIHAAHPVVVLALLFGHKHCLFFQHGMSVSRGGRMKRAVKRLWLSVAPRLVGARVVCSTRFALEKARGLGIRIREQDALIVPFGIESTRDSRPVETIRGETGVITVGMAGRLVPQKRLDLPLKALNGYSGRMKIRLLIAGEGPQKTKLERIVRTPNPLIEIRFLGHVSDMVSFYDALDLFVLPSREESFGLVVLEAFDRGVPVAVFPDVGGCLPLVKNGLNGFVMEEGVDGLRKLFARLDDDPSILGGMSERVVGIDLTQHSIRETRCKLEGLVFPTTTESTDMSLRKHQAPSRARAV
jgi:glycosyltransferase involved in cell wall biosynthesis